MRSNIQAYYSDSLYFCLRNVGYEYLCAPFFTDSILLVFCEKGKATICLNGRQYGLDERRMLVVLPKSELVLVKSSEDFLFTGLSFSMGLQEKVVQRLNLGFFSYVYKTPVWKLNDTVLKAARGFCSVYDYICNDLNSENKGEMISSIFSVFLQVFQTNVQQLQQRKTAESSFSGNHLLRGFLNHLQYNYKVDHRVSYYADYLCVSSKYLTQVVKKFTGVTPKELIDKRLAVESLYLLAKSEKTIQEVGFELGFRNQSYFGRFFRRMFDMSPISFRMNPNMDLMKKLEPSKFDSSDDFSQSSQKDLIHDKTGY